MHGNARVPLRGPRQGLLASRRGPRRRRCSGAAALIDGSQYIPATCVLSPERVTEYPDIWDLEDTLQARIKSWEETQPDPLYNWWSSAAPGTKIGGHPEWLQEPEWRQCPAGHRMDHLLTISDTEFDGGTYHRWIPVEEAGLWEGPAGRRRATQIPADLDFGMGSIYVFICRVCPDRPIAQVYQR